MSHALATVRRDGRRPSASAFGNEPTRLKDSRCTRPCHPPGCEIRGGSDLYPESCILYLGSAP
jgi:hypothetical protein